MNSLKRLVTAIRNSERIVIATHFNPDLDGICALLVCASLIKHFKRSTPILFCQSVIPSRYRFLLHGNKFVKKLPDFDLLIIIDSAKISRVFQHISEHQSVKLRSKLIINIDHHRSNDSFGKLRIIDDSASSSSEIMYKIFRKLGIKINRQLADVFYCGIYGDTGGFIYPNTTKDALKIASELVELGVKPSPLVKKINVKTFVGTLLLSEVLNTIEIKNGVGVMYLTQGMLKKTHAKMSDSENFISFCQAINGVRVSLFLREEKDATRISLRSDGIIDVDELASQYGGGGHRRAAGIRMRKGITAAKNEILGAIYSELKIKKR
jgi:phosphoesterase RecJ-like protein